jgi:hypothetical protein
MRTFKDNSGRTWTVELNVHQMKRIRARLGVDLVNVIALDAGGKVKVDLVDRIANDPCLLVDILWVCVEEEAKAAGVTDEQFGRSLAGDSIETATAAFLDELVDFFPGARRLFLKKAVGLARKYAGEMETALKTVLESPELEERLKTELQSATASQESAASIQTPAP